MFGDLDDQKDDPQYLASLYRTRWLMAHNRLHGAVHSKDALTPDEWQRYLDELATAPEVAKQPA